MYSWKDVFKMEGEGMQDVNIVLTALARVEQDVKHMSKQLEAISALSESTVRHGESLKSAHKRIDEAERAISDLRAEIEKRIDKMEADSKWTWRAIAGAVITYVVDKLFI